MRRFTRCASLTFIISFLSSSAALALEREFSLANRSPGAAEVESIPPVDLLVVRVTGLAPANEYQFAWELGEQEIPPLQFDASFLPGLEFLEANATACKTLADTAGELKRETREDAVPELVARVEKAIKACEADPSGEDPGRQIREARRLIDSTERRIEVYQIGRGQQVRIEISRLANAKATSARWVVTYRAPSLGRFVTSYGLAAVHNDSEILLTQREPDGTFNVAERKPGGNYDPLGVVAFTWLGERHPRALGGHLGVTGGFGWDGSNAAVFIGPSLSWGDNLTLTVGLGLHSEQRPDRRYEPGDELPLALSEDDLNDELYGFGALFGLTFRTGSRLQPPAEGSPDIKAQEKAAKLTVTAAAASAAPPGGVLDVAIKIANGGNGLAKNVSALVTIPKQSKLAAGTKWTCDKDGAAGDICRLAIGDVPAGQAVETVLKLEIVSSATGSIEVQPSARGVNVDEVTATAVTQITVSPPKDQGSSGR